jgi:hypothetical protein
MLELFCRVPEGIHLATGAHLTLIPFYDVIASLSAILLDDECYTFIMHRRQIIEGLPWIGAEELILLTARAWLDISARRAVGEKVDSRDLRKHANDVIPLVQLSVPDTQIPLAPKIAGDFGRFLVDPTADESYDPRELQIDLPLAAVIERLRLAYGVNRG